MPKKGRPVTQCQHCRLERKKRSAHVSCDCGQPEKPHHSKEKCVHLRDAEDKTRVCYQNDHLDDTDAAHVAVSAEPQGCCCHHGGKCTCATLKKETGDTIEAPHGPAVKPHLEKATSEGAITVFTNGHHKPVHRKNHAAHESGMPYKVPMKRSSTDNNVSTAARRSVDSLALDNNMPVQPSAYAPQTSAPFNTGRRKSKSEQPSPRMSAVVGTYAGLGDTKLSSVDFSTLSQTYTNQSLQSATSDGFGLSPLDPMSGVADSSFEPWSSYPSADSTSMPNNNPFGVWPTSSDHMHMTQPALTAASSGTTSEIDEIPPTEEMYGLTMPSIQEDLVNANFGDPPSGSSPQFNRRSLPPSFFGNTDFAMAGMPNDWQTSWNNYDFADASKLQTQQDMPQTGFDDVWKTPTMPSLTSVPLRALGLGGLPSTTRPYSRSVGPGSAPNEDIIKQLFPDIDISGGVFGAASNTGAMDFDSNNTVGEPSSSNRGPAPVDFGPMNTGNGFTSRPWSDGSMSIPNDTFTTSYDLDQDLSNPDFSTDWYQ